MLITMQPMWLLAENALAEKKDARLHDGAEDERKKIQHPAQHGGALPVPALENDVGRELFEIFTQRRTGI